MRRLLAWISSKLPMAVARRSDGLPYLFRYYLWRGKRMSLCLHHFVSSDPDPELHDHPTAWAIGLILAGGYTERRFATEVQSYMPHMLVDRWFQPGRINIVLGTTFHRILLGAGKDAWTIFLRGPRTKEWGFLRADGTKRVVTTRLTDQTR